MAALQSGGNSVGTLSSQENAYMHGTNRDFRGILFSGLITEANFVWSLEYHNLDPKEAWCSYIKDSDSLRHFLSWSFRARDIASLN